MVGDNGMNDEPLQILSGARPVFVFGFGFLVGLVTGMAFAVMIF